MLAEIEQTIEFSKVKLDLVITEPSGWSNWIPMGEIELEK